MKFAILLLPLSAAAHVRRHTLIEKPHPIVYHEMNLDMDKYRPPARETGLDNLQPLIAALTSRELEKLKKDKENLDRVQNEFLQSDLHKEALNMKIIPEE